ncbi:MAG: glycosyltransferase family 2 protein [Paracoccaceae bacterium]
MRESHEVRMGLWHSYKLRLRRRRYLIRAFRKRRDLCSVVDRTAQIKQADILLFATIRDEVDRLPVLLDHYRRMGVGHFIFVDNTSRDGSGAYLAAQPDVSLWSTQASYRRARFGIDWMNHLLARYGHGHWCLTVDADEFLTYPHDDSRPLRALTDWLDASRCRSMGAMLLDLYADDPTVHHVGPLHSDLLFDAGNYRISLNPEQKNLWIQGGARDRLFFGDHPQDAPALNKIPLVKWHWRYVYTSSTHALLPRGLNVVYSRTGVPRTCGLLLHTKMLHGFAARTFDALDHNEHFGMAREYRAYARGLRKDMRFRARPSRPMCDWRGFEALNLMSRGDWV